VTELCRRGQLIRTRKATPEGQTRARWYCDPEELGEYLAKHGAPDRKFHRAASWTAKLARRPEPGELSEIQLTLINSETWHELEDMQPVTEPLGAIRVTWSDGETFTIHQNGETDDYTYRDETDN
jgi:hypothetical protein